MNKHDFIAASKKTCLFAICKIVWVDIFFKTKNKGIGVFELTHCGLVMWYGDIDLSQHSFNWRPHQAIIWTNVVWSSMMTSGIYLRAIWQEMLEISIIDMSFKITDVRL